MKDHEEDGRTALRWVLGRQVVRMGVVGAGSGSCLTMGFGINGV
jgi:hypothetical protein